MNNSARGKAKGVSHGGKRDGKNARGFDAAEIVSFRYERNLGQSPPQRSGRKQMWKSSGPVVTKAQFVQAHFRFLLSPLTKPTEACLFEPDTIVPWQCIQCVVFPPKVLTVKADAARVRSASEEPLWDGAHGAGSTNFNAGDYEATGSEDLYSQTCPICLDDVQVPRITSCGHTFCYTCILRHLYSELTNSHKCPICAVSLCAADLKTVFYTQDAVEAVFIDRDTDHSGSYHPTAGNASVADAPGVVELQVGRDSSFQLLQFTKGSLVPAAVGYPAVPIASAGLRGVLPDCAAASARYSRISYLSVGMMRKLFEHDQQTLLQYRQQCLPNDANYSSHSDTAATNNASKAPTSVWGANAAQVATNSMHVPVASSSASEPAAPAWGSTRLQDLLRQTSDSSNSVPPTPPAPPSTAAQVLVGGDVEALPFIALALERQQLLESDFEAKLALQPLPVQPQRDTVEVLVRQTSSSGGSAGGGAMSSGGGAGIPSVDASSATLHTHQHTSGSLVYLHPICTKCLTDASQSPDSESTCPAFPVMTQVTGKVLEIEHLRVSADTKQRYAILRHLPLHSEVTLVEIDVAPLVPLQMLSKYSEELHKRANKRKERAKQEKREKRLEHDKLMAEALLAQERHDYEQKLRDMELAQLQDLMRGPALSVQSGGGSVGSARVQAGASRGYSGEWSAGEEGYYEGEDVHWRGGDAGSGGVTAPIALQAATVAVPALNDGAAKVSSFATITQMGGNFPTLGQTTSARPPGTGGARTVWGTAVAAPAAPASSQRANELGPTLAQPEREAATTKPQGAGGKKEKKTKIVLMSNASLRGAR